MPYLFNIAYLFLLVLVSPWIVYQRLFRGKYREGFAAKFWGAVPWRNSDRPCIWFHAVSVGEVNLLAVLLKEVAQRRPEIECVISTTTMTGFALARKKYTEHTVFYCPLDFSWAVRRAMRRIQPSLLVLAELELWPNLIRAAKQQGARVAIVNGRLSENSFRGYRRLRLLLRPILNQLDCVATQNKEYDERFRMLGMHAGRVHVTGSLKFDGAQTDRNNSRTKELRELAGYGARDIIFLAGSTQAPEEQLALAAFQALAPAHPNLRLILVPRHPHRFDEVASLLDRSGVHWMRRSTLEPMGNGEWGMGNEKTSEQGSGFGVQGSGAPNRGVILQQATNVKEPRTTNMLKPPLAIPHSPFPTPHSLPPAVLLVDTIGELGAWWGAAAIGFVGGSLFSSRGGQNMIEPAAYAVALSFGPNTQNFRDVVAMLLPANAAVCVSSGEELTTFVRQCLENGSLHIVNNQTDRISSFAATLGQNAATLVRGQQGATNRTWNLLEPLLPPRVNLNQPSAATSSSNRAA